MNHNQTMLARLAAFIVWALVAAGAVYWALKLLVRAPAAPAYSTAVASAATARGDLTRLLGASSVASSGLTAAPAVASRFKLHGVMAPKGPPRAKPSLQGVALISVDGKAPRAYAVGARIDDQLVLQSVGLRVASLGPANGVTSVNLEVPLLPPPATGRPPGLGATVPPNSLAGQGVSAAGAGLPAPPTGPVANPPAAPAPMPMAAQRPPMVNPHPRDPARSR